MSRVYTMYLNNVEMTQGGQILRIIGSDTCEIDNSKYGYELFQYFTPQLYSETDDIWFRSSEPER